MINNRGVKMKLKSNILIISILTIFITTFFSCTGGPVIQEFPDTANPSSEIDSLTRDMNSSMSRQVDVLSPQNFQNAKKSWEKARTDFEKMENPKIVLHNVAKSRAYLKQANQFANLASENIESVILAREAALKADAKNLFSDDFKDADDTLQDITSDIEENKLSNAIENRTSLQGVYLDLELRSIKHTNLITSKNTIDLAIKEGAAEFAPQNLAMALKSLDLTESYITANRHAVSEISSRSDETKRIANQLLKITRDSKKGGTSSLEQLSMNRDRQNKKLNSAQANLEVAKDENSNLKMKNINHINQEKFDEKFKKTISVFKSSEAEIYRQGNTLVIRLKGLVFAPGSSSLTKTNFPLLAKVQNVIRDFGQSNILVEGHTDSTGTKSLNKQLSTDRAKAVSEYISSNTGDEIIAINSIGYDYQKPLASNKTNGGRAQNRRVDVFISPVMNPSI